MSTGHCVYVVAQCDGGFVKVGMATDAFARLAQIQVGNPHRLTLEYTSLVNRSRRCVMDTEARAHFLLAPFRVTGEWFRCDASIAIEAIETAIDHLRRRLPA